MDVMIATVLFLNFASIHNTANVRNFHVSLHAYCLAKRVFILVRASHRHFFISLANQNTWYLFALRSNPSLKKRI